MSALTLMVKTLVLQVRSAFDGMMTKLFLAIGMWWLHPLLTALLVVVVCRVLMLLASELVTSAEFGLVLKMH